MKEHVIDEMETYKCNSTQNIYYLSEMCLERSFLEIYECTVSYGKIELFFRYLDGSWMLLMAILCTIGNLSTLLSLWLAIMKKKNGFEQKCWQITIFILHLSFVDLCWALTCAWPISYELLALRWPFGKLFCTLKVVFVIIIGATEPQLIAFISISRYFDLSKSELWERWTRNKFYLNLMLVTPWALSTIPVIPYFVPSMEVGFTWNCILGGCGIISTCDQNCNDSHSKGMELIGWYSFALILVSVTVTGIAYVLIGLKAKKSVDYLRKNGNMPSELDKREIKMTKTILILIAVHGICNLPMVVFQGSFANSSLFLQTYSEGICWHIFMIIYATQFGLNFFIYARSNSQYRQAYIDLWRFLSVKIHLPK